MVIKFKLNDKKGRT